MLSAESKLLVLQQVNAGAERPHSYAGESYEIAASEVSLAEDGLRVVVVNRCSKHMTASNPNDEEWVQATVTDALIFDDPLDGEVFMVRNFTVSDRADRPGSVRHNIEEGEWHITVPSQDDTPESDLQIVIPDAQSIELHNIQIGTLDV
jgi:hypothetical protein